jgi:hypothetical protein
VAIHKLRGAWEIRVYAGNAQHPASPALDRGPPVVGRHWPALGAPRPASGWASHRTAVAGLCQTGADRNAVTVLLQKLCLSLLAATTRA